ncbi:MAG: polysaccharide deacetylase family protein [Acidobacteriota bacterium]
MRAALLLLALTLSASAQTRTVAITVDDLPCANCSPRTPGGASQPSLMLDTNRRLVASLQRAHIPVTGFVVTHIATQAGNTGTAALQLWLNAGFDLGNHTDTHPSFADLTIEQEEAEILRADAVLRPLLAPHHRQPEFFRFPYNSTGETQPKHDALAAFLTAHGYAVATCTIDTSDYEFASAYARALGANDADTAQKIRTAYLTYSAAEIDFYASLNHRVLGYEPPQVLVLHDSLLNADTIDDVLALFRKRGYSFVNLSEAQHDPAYSIPNTYFTKFGPMWGYRWARDKNLGKLGLHEDEAPTWISDYAEGKPLPSQPAAKP